MDGGSGSRVFRWGIVGYGWVARDHAAPGMRASGAEVAAVCDPCPAARDASGAPGWDSVDLMLRGAACDAIYVATPNHLHRAAVEAAAAAGLPILCEKPMAATLADAEAMAEAARRAGVPYGTAYDQRHHPAHATMREWIRGGRLGTVTAVRIVYACWLDACWSADNWRADKARAGGGALLDLAPHGLDLVQFLLGEDPLVDVCALGQRRVQDYGVEDGAMLAARTESGVLASLHVAYNHRETLPRRRLEVVGTDGMLVAENTMGQVAGGALTFLDADGRARPVPVPHGDPFARQMVAFRRHARHGDGGFDLERDIRTERLLHQAMQQCL
jgi:predicted dehydrogenase